MSGGGCPRCGWVNTWSDSGDRGAARADHDRECPRVPEPGTRIELVRTSDQYTLLEPGERGTVTQVSPADPTGSAVVWIAWDSGSRLGLIEGEDEWKVVHGD